MTTMPTEPALRWAEQLGALAGTLFLFVVALAWTIWRIARWYMASIAEPESRKRIELIDQLAKSVTSITAGIATIVDNTSTVAVAIGRMEEKIEENHRGTMEHVGIARKFEELRPNLPTIEQMRAIVRDEIQKWRGNA